MSRAAKRLTMVVISLMYGGWKTIRRALSGDRRRQVVILTYHDIPPAEVARFDRQMAALSAYARPVFADACALEPLPTATVAITFDDAFHGVFDRALPILRRYHLVATVFVPTGSLGQRPSWIADRPGLGRVADPSVIVRADSRLVRFGSHTVSHPRLATVDAERLVYELAVSKQTLEGLTGRSVTTLALPFGSLSAHVVEAAAAAGYDRVFANVPVASHPGSVLIGRVNVTPRDWPIEFALKVRGAYAWMAVAVPAKRALRGVRRKAAAA